MGYGHDVAGAAQRGAARRTHAAVGEAYRWGALWMGGGLESANARRTFSLVLGALVKEALRRGASVEEVRASLERHARPHDLAQEARAAARPRRAPAPDLRAFSREEIEEEVARMNERELRRALLTEIALRERREAEER